MEKRRCLSVLCAAILVNAACASAALEDRDFQSDDGVGGASELPVESQWSVAQGGITSSRLVSGWASAADDVYVAALQQLFHFDGERWERVDTGVTFRVYSEVWGTEPDNVFVVGEQATIIRYDGQTWSACRRQPLAASATSGALRMAMCTQSGRAA